MQLRVSLAFARLPDKELDNLTLGVKDALTANAAYPTPPVTLANLETARTDFEQKIAQAASGGPPDTAVKNNSRQALLGMLRQIASYVQINCNNDMATLLSSGFQAMSTNRAQTPLDQADRAGPAERHHGPAGSGGVARKEHQPLRRPDQRPHR